MPRNSVIPGQFNTIKIQSICFDNYSVKTDTLPTIDLGDEVAKWLCTYFKREGLRLHYSAPDMEKRDSANAKKMWKHPAKPGDKVGLIAIISIDKFNMIQLRS